MKLSIFVTFAAQAMAMVPFSQIKFKRGIFLNEFVTPSSFFYQGLAFMGNPLDAAKDDYDFLKPNFGFFK